MKKSAVSISLLTIFIIFISACKGSESSIPGEPSSHPRIVLLKGEETSRDNYGFSKFLRNNFADQKKTASFASAFLSSLNGPFV
ncbi:MAG: hypothetical protein MUF36_07230 [Bacteroidales bacterium]|nr:hypothetical protein [Bacteroidales bacterium]